MYSTFLDSKMDAVRALVKKLEKLYPYVSVLGKHVRGKTIMVNSRTTSVQDTMERQCGFVAKLFNGKTYCEYSFTDIDIDHIDELVEEIKSSISFPDELNDNHVHLAPMDDEPLKKDFRREVEGKFYSVDEIIEKLIPIKDKIASYDPRIVMAMARLEYYQTSALFVSSNRELTQDYTWIGLIAYGVAKEGDVIRNNRDFCGGNSFDEVFDGIQEKIEPLCKTLIELLRAEMIEPGVYDIITEPSITGLIAHEAFGHGVEMDMFVKNRAKSRQYLGKPVASKLVSMHDGAAATYSNASYFFDDDGVLAHDTLIIKDGILQTGISDAVSALQLGTTPTGNGRRESYARKAYTRMTNTFFSPGTSTKEEMIASIKHGYLLSQTDNGMEDPKNWNIQCVCAYGREIKDGKLTGKIVAPVVMSGYVIDLLMSISAVSSDFEVTGSGHCGKGYKEWVTVSDGGPYLKARCKLG